MNVTLTIEKNGRDGFMAEALGIVCIGDTPQEAALLWAHKLAESPEVLDAAPTWLDVKREARCETAMRLRTVLEAAIQRNDFVAVVGLSAELRGWLQG